MGSSRSPSLSHQHREENLNSSTDSNHQTQSPSPSITKGKLLIDMGDNDYNKKSDDDDNDDSSDSDSSSNFTFVDNNRVPHLPQARGATSSALLTEQQKMTLSPSSPGSSDNKSEAETPYKYSPLNLSSNKKSPLKITFKRLSSSAWVDKTAVPEIPNVKQVSLPSASSSQSESSSDSDSSNEGDHCRTPETSSELKRAQKSPAPEEFGQNKIFIDYSAGRTTKDDLSERSNRHSSAIGLKYPVHASDQKDAATNHLSQDNLLDESLNDNSNIQGCKNPDSLGLQSSISSPSQSSKILDNPTDTRVVSESAPQDSSQVEVPPEELSSGSNKLDNQEHEGSYHDTGFKMNCASNLNSQGDLSDELNSGVDEDDDGLYSSSEL